MFHHLRISPDPFNGVYDSMMKSMKLENESDAINIAISTGFILGVICGRCCSEKEFTDFRAQMEQLRIDIRPPQPGVNPDGSVDLEVATRIMNG